MSVRVLPQRRPRAGEITARSIQVPCGEVDSYAKLPATPILTRVDLQHTNATIVTNALRPFFAHSAGNASVTVGSVGNNRSILLRGFGAEVAAAYHLIQLIDRDEAVASKMQVVPLEHAAAEDIVATMEQVLLRRIQQQAAESGMPMGGTVLRVIPQPNTNSVIVSGGVPQIAEALELIAQLDVPATSGARSPRPAGGAGERRMKVVEGKGQTAPAEAPKPVGGPKSAGGD